MIQRIGENRVNTVNLPNLHKQATVKNSVALVQPNEFSKNYTATSLVNAYQAYNGINFAKTISFGRGLASALMDMDMKIVTCKDEEKGKEGEVVGKRVPASDLIKELSPDLLRVGDAIKTNVEVKRDVDPKHEKPDVITEARTQLKKTKDGILYEMAVRQPRTAGTDFDRNAPLSQFIQITQNPELREKAYVLNTKGNLMTVVEDGNNVILSNAGTYSLKPASNPHERLIIHAETPGNDFYPFGVEAQPVRTREILPSIGDGTDMIIGMEDDRFVPEIIDSIKTFEKKIDKGDILLDQFIANPEAKNIQLAMLAGGFGSRAEYTNASSDRIFHDNQKGATSTKGVFRTATGLTPMETTFISLHNAGLLDCSKGKFGIGKNIKLYLNKSGINKGNGGFTLDIYNLMDRPDRKSLAVFPNDSMSRMTNASIQMANLINSGEAAVAMIAKEVKEEDARGKLGIMKIDKNNQILEFKEKPDPVPSDFVKNGNCLTNTFQFAVSKEAFKAISLIDPYIPLGRKKEEKDWSKTYIPIIMTIIQNDDINTIKATIEELVKADKDSIPTSVIAEAKAAIGNQKIYSVPTSEPWADCGSLNALYHTTMQIASNLFPLEDFERDHVLKSINTRTGLVASSPEQKAEIEAKYDINGQVMVVPKAKRVDKKIVDEYIAKGLVSINE